MVSRSRIRRQIEAVRIAVVPILLLAMCAAWSGCLFARGRDLGVFRVTAYANDPRCVGKYHDGRTATGWKADARKRIVAVDPRVIPLHSIVEIEGLGRFHAEDVGGAIKGKRIDVLMPSYKAAKEFGVKYLHVRLIRRGR